MVQTAVVRHSLFFFFKMVSGRVLEYTQNKADPANLQKTSAVEEMTSQWDKSYEKRVKLVRRTRKCICIRGVSWSDCEFYIWAGTLSAISKYLLHRMDRKITNQ